MEKVTSTDRKVTICMQCNRKFWYIDPRPGGRPRQKCGVCSTRPPRYPWDFIDEEGTSEHNSDRDAVLADSLLGELSDSHQHLRNDGRSVTVQKRRSVIRRRRNKEKELVIPSNTNLKEVGLQEESRTAKKKSFDQVEGYPLPSPVDDTDLYSYKEHSSSNNGSESQEGRENYLSTSPIPGENEKLELEMNNSTSELIRALKQLERRLEKVENELKQLNGQFIKRSEWVDLSARLDIVEKYMSEMLNKVQNQLEAFSKEVHQVAVVPERELTEMFELVRMIKHYLDNS